MRSDILESDTRSELDIIELASRYASHLVCQISKLPCLADGNLHYHQHDADISVITDESIECGQSGYLLFLMELYLKKGEIELLCAIDNLIEDLVLFCKENPTQNYGLYNGRSGVAYLLLQRYNISKEQKFITYGLDIIEQANQAFLHSKYTTDYLYDGRSGVLLVILEYYKATSQPFLLPMIDQFLTAILDNAQLSEDGIYWQYQEELMKPASCGFAFGTAGVKYVLHHLNQHCQSDILDYVDNQSAKFLNSRWIEEDQCWRDNFKLFPSINAWQAYRQLAQTKQMASAGIENDWSWISGSIGIALSSAKNYAPEKGENILNNLIERIFDKGEEESKIGSKPQMLEKLIFLVSCPSLLSASQMRHLQNVVSDYFTAFKKAISGDFLFGDFGIIYLLLRSLKPENGLDNIYFPFSIGQMNKDLIDVKMNVGINRTRKVWLNKFYPRTINLLDKINPVILTNYFESQRLVKNGDELALFANFVLATLNKPDFVGKRNQLLDVLTLERTKIEFYQKQKATSLGIYFDVTSFKISILEFLNNPEELILDQKICLSNHVKTVRSKWNWELYNEMELMVDRSSMDKHSLNYSLSSGNYEYIFLMSIRWEDIESTVNNAYSLLLHFFDRPATLRQGKDSLLGHIKELPDHALVALLKEGGGVDMIGLPKSTILDMLEVVIVNTLKKWIYLGVLELT